MLGTSDRRNSLREDQDKECLDSLRKHQEKEQAKKSFSVAKKNLQFKKKCKFPKSGHVGTVYDWVGSLSLTPEYFILSMVDSMDLNPALLIETVGQTTLSMHECDESLPFPYETVCFHGFGEPSKIPSEDNMWKPVSEKSPLVLLEEDEA